MFYTKKFYDKISSVFYDKNIKSDFTFLYNLLARHSYLNFDKISFKANEIYVTEDGIITDYKDPNQIYETICDTYNFEKLPFYILSYKPHFDIKASENFIDTILYKSQDEDNLSKDYDRFKIRIFTHIFTKVISLFMNELGHFFTYKDILMFFSFNFLNKNNQSTSITSFVNSANILNDKHIMLELFEKYNRFFLLDDKYVTYIPIFNEDVDYSRIFETLLIGKWKEISFKEYSKTSKKYDIHPEDIEELVRHFLIQDRDEKLILKFLMRRELFNYENEKYTIELNDWLKEYLPDYYKPSKLYNICCKENVIIFRKFFSDIQLRETIYNNINEFCDFLNVEYEKGDQKQDIIFKFMKRLFRSSSKGSNSKSSRSRLLNSINKK